MNASLLLSYALKFVIIFPSIILHEVAHGYMAYRLGDPTAKNAGRLTLNPIKHIDPIGTIFLPLLLIVTTGGFIGWAKPVPFNPMYFKNRRLGELLTGIAGPVTNLIIAIVFGLSLRFMPIPQTGISLGQFTSVYNVFVYVAWANLALMFFNLVPIPPLDGSRVLQHFLPDAVRRGYQSMERYGFMILFGLLYIAPWIWSGYIQYTAVPVFELLSGLKMM